MMNSELLAKRVKESGARTEAIAATLEISVPTLYSKIKGESEFKLSEAVRMKHILSLTNDEFDEIFLQ